jgi:hypothetical protein
MNAVTQILSNLFTTVSEAFDTAVTAIEAIEVKEATEDPVQLEPTPEPTIVQATLRGNILHIQEGRQGRYSKADISLGENDVVAFKLALAAPETNTATSLHGSSTTYVVGTRDGSNYSFAGLKFAA